MNFPDRWCKTNELFKHMHISSYCLFDECSALTWAKVQETNFSEYDANQRNRSIMLVNCGSWIVCVMLALLPLILGYAGVNFGYLLVWIIQWSYGLLTHHIESFRYGISINICILDHWKYRIVSLCFYHHKWDDYFIFLYVAVINLMANWY